MRPFWRLVWKEYREQRSFWLGMFALALAASAVLLWLRPPGRPPLLGPIDVGILAAVLYAAGAGAVTFAAEHERGTFAWLRQSLSARLLGGAKIFWVLASGLLLMGVLLTCGSCFSDQRSVADNEAMALRQGCLMLAEASAWGICCSLLVREPLRAAILAMFLTTLEIHALVALADNRVNYSFQLAAYDRASAWRLLALALVVGLDLWLIPRWLSENVPVRLVADQSPSNGRDGGAARRSLLPRACEQWAHLVWQAWREALPVIALLGGLAAVGVVLQAVGRNWREFFISDVVYELPDQWLSLLFCSALAACCGTFVFRADQRRQSRRFLAERGISPSLVWLSRQTAWGVALITALVVLLALPTVRVLQALDNATRWHDAEGRPLYDDFLQSRFGLLGFVAFLACVPLAYAAGQLASMFVRQSLPAGVLAFVLAGLTSAWTLLMFALGISGWWSALPIFGALLAATWLRSRHWLIDRGGLAGWFAPVGVLAGTFIALAVAVPLYRVRQIPDVPSELPDGLSLAGDTPAGHETLELYLKAWQEKKERWDALVESHHPAKDDDLPREVAIEDTRVLIAQSRSMIDDVLMTSRRDECYFPMWTSDPHPQAASDVVHLAYFLLEVAEVRIAEGQLDDAAEAYLGALRIARHLRMSSAYHLAPQLDEAVFYRLPSWAAHEGQTLPRIRALIASLGAWRASLPSPLRAVARQRQFHAALIDNLVEASAALPGMTKISTVEWFESRLPWERARARRLLDYATNREVSLLRDLAVRLEFGVEVESLLPEHVVRQRDRFTEPRLKAWLASTPLLFDTHYMRPRLAWYTATDESQYRVTLGLLALVAWKQEHGELPDEFALAAKEYLGRVPTDPFSGRPFLYYPKGIPVALRETADRITLPAGEPFLWSIWNPVTQSIRVGVTGDRDEPDAQKSYYRIRYYHESDNSLYDTLEAGLPVPIP